MVARAMFLLSLVAISLRLIGFRNTYHRLYIEQTGADSDVPDFISEAVDVASRNMFVFHPTCLPRSLVLWHMLRRHGSSAELHLGVRRNHGEFIAHAWVEANGRVVNDAPDISEQFTPLDMFDLSMEQNWKIL